MEVSRKVAVDLEGTLTGGETWRGVVAWLRSQGRGGAYRRFLAARVPRLVGVRMGLLDRQAFRDGWIGDFAAFFAGLDEPALRDLGEWVVERELWPQRRRGLMAEITGRVARGEDVVLASGTYQPVLDAFAARIGASAAGTQLELSGGLATGRIGGSVTTGARKAERLTRWLDRRVLVAAYGDSAADVPMLELAATPIAVDPDRALRSLARERGWRVMDLREATGAVEG